MLEFSLNADDLEEQLEDSGCSEEEKAVIRSVAKIIALLPESMPDHAITNLCAAVVASYADDHGDVCRFCDTIHDMAHAALAGRDDVTVH